MPGETALPSNNAFRSFDRVGKFSMTTPPARNAHVAPCFDPKYHMKLGSGQPAQMFN
jgi:hypothetical protein